MPDFISPLRVFIPVVTKKNVSDVQSVRKEIKQTTAPLEKSAKELSFEWLHQRISSKG